jgi:hypothetical protein
MFNLDGAVKSRITLFSVIPAKAGIQCFQAFLDPGLRRGDGFWDFLRIHQRWMFDVGRSFFKGQKVRKKHSSEKLPL